MKKHIFSCIVAMSTCLCSETFADASLILDPIAKLMMPNYCQWNEDIRAQFKTMYEIIVPEEEQIEWSYQSIDHSPYIGLVGELSKCSWTRFGDTPRKSGLKEDLYITLYPKPVGKGSERRQYVSIEELFDDYKSSNEDLALTFTKINDHDGLLESKKEHTSTAFYDSDNDEMKKVTTTTYAITRNILSGNWWIKLSYQVKLSPPKNPNTPNNFDWEKQKKLWINRFSQVDFNNQTAAG